jgi:hypothetical protein
VGLRAWARQAALARPGVLLVACPGGTGARLAVEAELLLRGWSLVTGPACADLLVVAGDPAADADRADGRPDRSGSADLSSGRADWADALWQSMPAPRARVVVRDPARVSAALAAAHAALLADVREEGARTGRGRDHGDHGHASDGLSNRDHGGHEGSPVAGLPMAGRADDRDGLRLDRLHIPWGPALPDWPAGLVLRLALQGDVLQQVEVDPLPSASGALPFWNEPWLRALRGERVTQGAAARRLCAAHLDSTGRFLAVSGWDDAAARARRLRGEVLAGAPAAAAGPPAQSLARRVRRSRTLRRLTGGLGVLPRRLALTAGVSGPALAADGDAYDRLLVWLDELASAAGRFGDERLLGADDTVGPRGRADGATPPSRALLDVLPGLLTGAEFGAARVILASLDPDTDEAAPAPDRAVAAGG